MTPVWVNRGETAFDQIAAFISERIWGKARTMPGDTILGVLTGRALAAGVIFQNYSKDHGTIELSAASDSKRWLTRPILFDMHDYVFNQLGCQAAITRIDPDNTRLARIFSAYGYKRYDIPRLRGRNKAETIFVLGDDDWQANGFHKENRNG